jgi:Transglutaminase-like superfamily
MSVASDTVLPPGVTEPQVLSLLEKLRRIPDSARDFDWGVDAAWTRLRVNHDLMAYLTEHGLPYRIVNGVPKYDRVDIVNVSMRLGFGPLARAPRRFWPLALCRSPASGSVRYEMRYKLACPQPGHDGPCRFVAALPGDATAECVTPSGGPGPQVRLDVSAPTAWPPLPPEVRAVVDTAGDIDYLMLPNSVRHDIDFVTRAGVSDCAGVAKILYREGLARGLEVRACVGLIASPPFSTPHNWAEFRVDGTWVPVDPILVREMVEWGVLDPAEWHPYRSTGALLCRLGDYDTMLAHHDGTPLDISVPTRLLSSAG